MNLVLQNVHKVNRRGLREEDLLVKLTASSSATGKDVDEGTATSLHQCLASLGAQIDRWTVVGQMDGWTDKWMAKV